jgi:hypothetical protein
VLLRGESGLRHMAQEVAAGKQPAQAVDPSISLLDLQDDMPSSSAKAGLDDVEKENLRLAASEATEKLDRLGKIRRERDEVLKDLKEKVSRIPCISLTPDTNG